MTLDSWLIFMAIWIAVSIPLGPNALNCISASATHGFAKGLWSVVGIVIAATIHITLAISGITAFLNANPALFEVMRWLGVGYLARMGLSLLFSKGKFKLEKQPKHVSHGQLGWQLVRRAILVSMSNPKTIFIWLAVFTQFINVKASLAPQLLILVPSALLVTTIVYISYCAVGSGINRLLSGNRKMWLDRFAGSTYLAFALGLATADLRKT